MGISERRAREREQRRLEILRCAWRVAEAKGWAGFSVERVAAEAELGRATVYGYFESLEALVLELARDALHDLSERVAAAPGLPEALDVPVRLAQNRPAAFALLFPPSPDPREAFSTEELAQVRAEAQALVGRLRRLSDRSGATLPDDARSAAAFVAGISMASAMVPELRASTTLRRRFQDFCLGSGGDAKAAPDSDELKVSGADSSTATPDPKRESSSRRKG
jgi:AcrR family transcriptional regulator